MEQEADFNQQLFAALEDRAQWINSTVFPKLDESYHLHLTCIKNLFEVLEKKSLITPDPYKHDKKISDIVAPDGAEFNESDKSVVMGSRLSDYETMIDFVCNYVKFSLDIKMDRLNKLLNLNKTILWNSLTPNSPKPNTRNLAVLINMAKSGAPQLTLSLINENQSIAVKTSGEIEAMLKTVLVYKREAYKGEIRKNVLMSQQFDSSKAYQSANALQAELRRLFPTLMPKIPYSAELVNELIQEETGSDKTALRDKLLSSLKVATESRKKKKQEVDTHGMIMDAVRTLGGLSEQYDTVIAKIQENHDVLEGAKNGFFDKLAKLLRKAFNMEEPAVDYEIQVSDPATSTKRKETIHYNQFITELSKRSRYYAAMATRNAPGYAKLNAQTDEVVLEFVGKQLAENAKVLQLLAALDEFFKNSAEKSSRGKIKGIKMELSMLKNILQKTNQQKADYVAYIEEKAQMQKLGITEDE